MTFLTHLGARRLLLLVVALPTLLAAVFFGLLASDRYVSGATLVVRQAHQDAASPLPGAALLLAGVNPASREDTLYVQEYVHSLGLLLKLDEKLKLRAHFSDPARDLVYRLPADASQEDFLAYYRERVTVHYDEVSALLSLRVQAFEPAFAQALGRALLEEGERFVNAFSQKIASEQLRFAEAELATAAQRVEQAQADLLRFQTRHKLLDPLSQAQASGALTAELQAQLSKQEAELQSLRSYLNDEAFPIRALKAQIGATRSQLEAERSRTTVSGKQEQRLNTLAVQFQALQLQGEFARDAYKLALSAVESSRIEATRKLKSLVVVEPPALPEEAEQPRRLYNVLTVLLVSLALYALARLVLATIREHQD